MSAPGARKLFRESCFVAVSCPGSPFHAERVAFGDGARDSDRGPCAHTGTTYSIRHDGSIQSISIRDSSRSHTRDKELEIPSHFNWK